MSLSSETNRRVVVRLKIQNMMDKVLFPHVSFLMSTEGKHFITEIFDIRIHRILFYEVISCSLWSPVMGNGSQERGESRRAVVTDMQNPYFLINWISFIPAAPSVICAGRCQPPQIKALLKLRAAFGLLVFQLWAEAARTELEKGILFVKSSLGTHLPFIA